MNMKFHESIKWLFIRCGHWCVTYGHEKPQLSQDKSLGFLTRDAECLFIDIVIDPDFFPKCSPDESLHRVVNGIPEKYVDIPADGEPVIVGFCKRISSGMIDNYGNLMCYYRGMTKWTSEGMTEPCAKWRRPTEEELKQ